MKWGNRSSALVRRGGLDLAVQEVLFSTTNTAGCSRGSSLLLVLNSAENQRNGWKGAAYIHACEAGDDDGVLRILGRL